MSDFWEKLNKAYLLVKSLRRQKCFYCGTPVADGAINKTIRLASGRWVTVCARDYKAMGSPGRLRNKTRKVTPRGPYVDPDQLTLF